MHTLIREHKNYINYETLSFKNPTGKQEIFTLMGNECINTTKQKSRDPQAISPTKCRKTEQNPKHAIKTNRPK